MKKSITIVGKPVDFAYVIKDIDIDSVTLEKYSVDCKMAVDAAWGATEQTTSAESGEKILEIILQDKLSYVKLVAKAPILEIASKMGGKIVKDFKTSRTKRGKKVYLEEIQLFKEVS